MSDEVLAQALATQARFLEENEAADAAFRARTFRSWITTQKRELESESTPTQGASDDGHGD